MSKRLIREITITISNWPWIQEKETFRIKTSLWLDEILENKFRDYKKYSKKELFEQDKEILKLN